MIKHKVFDITIQNKNVYNIMKTEIYILFYEIFDIVLEVVEIKYHILIS